MLFYTSLGKEVLRDGHHYADAISTGAAERIARALNDTDTPLVPIMPELITRDKPGPLFIEPKHAVRQESDEYACACGARWPVSEGEEHP